MALARPETFNDKRLSGFRQVVDTSHIIQNLDDALKTEKTFCLFEDETEFKVKICEKLLTQRILEFDLNFNPFPDCYIVLQGKPDSKDF